MLSRRPWRLLLGLWGAYWVLLAAFMLGPLALAVLRATKARQGEASFNVSFGNDGLSATVVERGQTIYTSSIHFVTAALLIAGPPLLAWLAFVIGERRIARRETAST
jgi:hypothetical protein